MRLIDADALIEVIQKNDYMLTAKHNSMALGMFTSGIRQAVDEATTIDPVKHGHWIEGTSFGGVRCSECGYGAIIMLHYSSNYCPNCGAKMDGEA